LCSVAGVSSSPGALKTLALASATEGYYGGDLTTATTFTTAPTPTSSNAIVVDLDNPNITWGEGWTDVPSSCNSSAKSKSVGLPSSMTYSWLGGGIYLSISTWNATFTLWFNGKLETYGNQMGFVTTPANCSYIFIDTDLVQPGDGELNGLTIYVDDESPGAWSFEVNSIIVLQNLTSSGTSGGGSGSSGGSGGGSSKGSGRAMHSFTLKFSSYLWASIVFFVGLTFLNAF